jgi:stress-induced-phosphoprotein 1
MDKKEQANKYFKEGNFNKALTIYDNLLDLDNTNYIILANRSALYIKLGEYNLALNDAILSIKYKSDWSKTWGRLGAALYGLNKLEESLVAYNKANELGPLDIYRIMIDQIKKDLNKTNHITELLNEQVVEDLFGNLYNSIINNRKIMDKLTNPEFQNKIMSLQHNPLNIINDKEVMNLLNDLLNNL